LSWRGALGGAAADGKGIAAMLARAAEDWSRVRRESFLDAWMSLLREAIFGEGGRSVLRRCGGEEVSKARGFELKGQKPWRD